METDAIYSCRTRVFEKSGNQIGGIVKFRIEMDSSASAMMKAVMTVVKTERVGDIGKVVILDGEVVLEHREFLVEEVNTSPAVLTVGGETIPKTVDIYLGAELK